MQHCQAATDFKPQKGGAKKFSGSKRTNELKSELLSPPFINN